MNKIVIGLTGEIGCGKSWITSLFEEISKIDGIPVVNVDIDAIAHSLLEYNPLLQEEVILAFGTAKREELSKKVFTDSEARHRLDNIFIPYIRNSINQVIEESQGIILINGALIIESGFFQEICDYQTILVLAPADKQWKNLLKRGYSMPNALRRVAAQSSSLMKYVNAIVLSEEANRGFIDCIYNYRGDENKQVYELLLKYNEKLKSNIHS